MNRIVRMPRVSKLLGAALVAMTAAAFAPLALLIATAGDLDPSFGIAGVATAPSYFPFAYPTAVAVQADGKIIAASGGTHQLGIARFNPDGTIDEGFGIRGGVSINLGQDDSSENAIKVLVRPDGRIVVVAGFDGFFLPARVAILQYHPDGTLDTGFGTNGIVVATPTGILVHTGDAALQADGGILVAGHAYFDQVDEHDFTVQRFTPSGALDTAFGTGGLIRTNMLDQEEGFAFTIQPDGRFIVAGFSNSREAPFVVRQFAFVRYLPDGTRDPSFGTDGKVLVDPGLGLAEESWLNDLLVQPDGRIVGAGYSIFGSWERRAAGAVVRLLSDGQLDTSFSDDGIAIFEDDVIANTSNRHSIARLALQSNGRLLALLGHAVFGIRPDGTLDPDFHGDGMAGIPGFPTDMTLQNDGKIVLGAAASVGSPAAFRVIRLIAENTPPALTPAAITVQRGTSPRLTIGTASDTSDPLTNLVVAPVAGTVPEGLTFTSFQVNATTGAVSAVVTPSCTMATGTFNVQFSVTDGGNATTFATVPVEVIANTSPTIHISDVVKVEGISFFTPAVVVVTASGGVCEPITVRYATADGTASELSDYTATSGIATIAVNQLSTTISIPVRGDQASELDEMFFVNLESPVNATITDSHGVVTIRDDDPSLVQFVATTPTLVDVLETDEPTAEHVITLKLSRLTALDTNAAVRVFAGGAASSGTDYLRLSPEFVHFAPGQTEAEIRIGIIGDLVAEPVETVTVEIRNWSSAAIGSPSSVLIRIRDDDGPPDSTAPTLDGFSTRSPNEAGWITTDASVRVAASDGSNGSGVKSVSYTMTGAQTAPLTVVPATDPFAVTRVVIPVTVEGITVVSFFAEDVEGNVAPTQSLTVRLDKTTPAVVVTSPTERAYTLNEPATVAFTCTDGGSGIASCSATAEPGAALDTSSIGTKVFIASARDLAGNPAGAFVVYTVTERPSDTDKPVIVGSVPNPNAAGWHKADLAVALSASDGSGTGVKSISYSLSGAQTAGLTVVPAANVSIPIVTEGITVVTFFAEDVAGNVAASQSLTVRLDKTAPGVAVTSPQARAYTLNEAAAAAYACTDGGSGVASCTGTTVVGAPIDTASAGAKSYAATATDIAGNVTTVTTAYSVVVPPPTFTIRALYDPLKEHTRNSAIPIKLHVENAAGVNVSSAELIVEALAVSSGTEIGPAEEEALDAGHSNPLGRFRFVADGAYLFNLKTTGLKAGPYMLIVRVAGDTALHVVPFLIREP